jgi:hypothetical protein
MKELQAAVANFKAGMENSAQGVSDSPAAGPLPESTVGTREGSAATPVPCKAFLTAIAAFTLALVLTEG